MIVTCHEPYLKWLPEAIASIDRQIPEPSERVVVFDRCKPPTVYGERWRFIEGDWWHPSGARNTGIAVTRAPWLIFWDAENMTVEGYVIGSSPVFRRNGRIAFTQWLSNFCPSAQQKLSSKAWASLSISNPQTNQQGAIWILRSSNPRHWGFNRWSEDWSGKNKRPVHFQFCTGR